MEKDLIRLDTEAGTIAFQAKNGKSLAQEMIYESFLATSLYGPNGIEAVRYLEITALGEVVMEEGTALLTVADRTQRFALGSNPDRKPSAGEQTPFQRLREAMAKGAKITSVTGYIHRWNVPISAKDADQLAGKKPPLLIVTDFQTSPQ